MRDDSGGHRRGGSDQWASLDRARLDDVKILSDRGRIPPLHHVLMGWMQKSVPKDSTGVECGGRVGSGHVALIAGARRRFGDPFDPMTQV